MFRSSATGRRQDQTLPEPRTSRQAFIPHWKNRSVPAELKAGTDLELSGGGAGHPHGRGQGPAARPTRGSDNELGLPFGLGLVVQIEVCLGDRVRLETCV